MNVTYGTLGFDASSSNNSLNTDTDTTNSYKLVNHPTPSNGTVHEIEIFISWQMRAKKAHIFQDYIPFGSIEMGALFNAIHFISSLVFIGVRVCVCVHDSSLVINCNTQKYCICTEHDWAQSIFPIQQMNISTMISMRIFESSRKLTPSHAMRMEYFCIKYGFVIKSQMTSPD